MKVKKLTASLLTATVLMCGSGVASASLIPLGIDFYLNAPATTLNPGIPLPATDSLVANYLGSYVINARSIYTDTNTNGAIDLLEPVQDTGYAWIANLGKEGPGATSYSGADAGFLGTSWGLFMDYSNLLGVVGYVANGGAEVGAAYYSGDIALRFVENESGTHNPATNGAAPVAMTLHVTGSEGTFGNINLFANVDFTGANAAYHDLFMSPGADGIVGTADDKSFYDIWSEKQPLPFALYTISDTNNQAYVLPTACGEGLLCRESTLNMKSRFYVPEPASIALMGLGLLGLGLSRRNKKAA